MKDTIVAISTALGVGAISIVRVSGEDSIEIVNKITKKHRLCTVESNTINYDKIVYKDEIIDEVLISVIKAPHTYTGENVVEINCHGGISTTNKILQILLEVGCRLAKPGEFTERRFLNGKIDLLQAESVMDLLNSKNETTRKMAINQMDGKVSKLIRDLRQDFIEILANINVNIDYPEYEDIEEITIQDIKEKIGILEQKLNKIIIESKNARVIKEGITTAIIGKPNVGKSSLLNKLIKEDKAIVTDIEGTTRDIVEGSIDIDGLTLNIIDTAGIRNTDDLIESIGVQKSKDLIKRADLVLYVLNNNEELTEEDKIIINELSTRNHIIIINKSDLERKIDTSEIKEEYIEISVLNDEGIEKLINRIKQLYELEKFNTQDLTYLTNARGLAILEQVLHVTNELKKSLELNTPIDMIEIDIKKIWNLLGEITGDTYEDELIDQLFSQFCLGK